MGQRSSKGKSRATGQFPTHAKKPVRDLFHIQTYAPAAPRRIISPPHMLTRAHTCVQAIVERKVPTPSLTRQAMEGPADGFPSDDEDETSERRASPLGAVVGSNGQVSDAKEARSAPHVGGARVDSRSSGMRVSNRRFSLVSESYTGLLPPPIPKHKGRLCVVLDMDETLIHSKFESQNTYRQDEERKQATRKADIHLTLSLNGGQTREKVGVFKRPGLDAFLHKAAERFEVVVFTAAIPLYADPVLDAIDKRRTITARLFRGSTITFEGQPYVKDLSVLGRDMRRIVLVDNNPAAMVKRRRLALTKRVLFPGITFSHFASSVCSHRLFTPFCSHRLLTPTATFTARITRQCYSNFILL